MRREVGSVLIRRGTILKVLYHNKSRLTTPMVTVIRTTKTSRQRSLQADHRSETRPLYEPSDCRSSMRARIGRICTTESAPAKNATCALPPAIPHAATKTKATGRRMSLDHLRRRILISAYASRSSWTIAALRRARGEASISVEMVPSTGAPSTGTIMFSKVGPSSEPALKAQYAELA